MILALVVIGAVALQRLCEARYAARNTRALLARGGVETGRGHFPLLIGIHAAWLGAMVVALPQEPRIHWPLFFVYLALQAARAWVIASLGPYWTTRIVTLPDAPLVRSGPYRFLRHPNYLVVAGEIAVLPLVFGEIWVAAIFSLLNGAMLAWRIRVENAALAERRAGY